MTAHKGFKKLVRDIQDRSGWGYQVCHRLVTKLGYERVSRELDDRLGSTDLGLLERQLDVMARLEVR